MEDFVPEDGEEGVEDTTISQNQGERSIDRPAMETLIDTKSHLKNLEKQFKGQVERDGRWEKVSDELATNIFIDKMISGLRSIVNQFSIYTYLEEQTAELILREKNEEFIRACVDEASIENENDMELMINIYDHALQTFMGLPTKGHGSIFLRDLGSGNQALNMQPQEKKSFISDIGNIFSIGKK